MSAWMCSDKHLNAISAAYVDNVAGADFDEVFGSLYAANVKSLKSRYPSNYMELVGSEPPCASYTEGKGLCEAIGKIGVLKLAQSYDYQSCEDSSWPGSVAKRVADSVESESTSNLPGYKAAPWSI